MVEVEHEYEEVVGGVEESARESAGGGLSSLTQRGNLAPFLIGMTLMFGQQLSGMNAVMFYAVSIFQVWRNNILVPGFHFALLASLGREQSVY